MNELVESVKKLISKCSMDEQKSLKQFLSSLLPHPLEREWGIEAEVILSAIRRSSDLTKRGVRGIIAEAVFENSVMPSIETSGWEPVTIVGNPSFDVHVQRENVSARIQIKLQRLEKRVPKFYYPRHYQEGSLYVVEVQKTRSGKKTAIPHFPDGEATVEVQESITVQTRPYRFGDFDILAVSMQPSSGDWNNFRYTVASWLLPRAKDETLIEIFQPVASVPNDVWTDDLAICLDWFASGEKRSVLTNILHLPKSRQRDI
jgi:hypothetical protein